jgi:hypothetical protein
VITARGARWPWSPPAASQNVDAHPVRPGTRAAPSLARESTPVFPLEDWVLQHLRRRQSDLRRQARHNGLLDSRSR